MYKLLVFFKLIMYVVGVVGLLCVVLSVFKSFNRARQKQIRDKRIEEMRKLRERIYFRDRD